MDHLKVGGGNVWHAMADNVNHNDDLTLPEARDLLWLLVSPIVCELLSFQHEAISELHFSQTKLSI